MSYFSRLSDIVTCNLSEILSRADDPLKAVQSVIAEMEEGLAGARRSVAAAAASEERVQKELTEYRQQIEQWATRARSELRAGREDQARLILLRKQEVEDVVAGLEQQLQAAAATRAQLTTMMRALEARRAEAERKREELQTGRPVTEPAPRAAFTGARAAERDPVERTRQQQIEAELEALKREIGRTP